MRGGIIGRRDDLELPGAGAWELEKPSAGHREGLGHRQSFGYVDRSGTPLGGGCIAEVGESPNQVPAKHDDVADRQRRCLAGFQRGEEAFGEILGRVKRDPGIQRRQDVDGRDQPGHAVTQKCGGFRNSFPESP